MGKLKQKIIAAILIPAALLVATPFSLISDSIASAATVSGKDVAWRVTAEWYYRAITTCMRAAVYEKDGLKLETNFAEVQSKKLINAHRTDTTFLYSYYMTGGPAPLSDLGKDDGKTVCSANNYAVFTNGLSFLGIDPLELVCQLNDTDWNIYTRNNNGPCSDTSSSENFKSMTSLRNRSDRADRFLNEFGNIIKRHVWGKTSEPVLSDADKYELYSKALIRACTTGRTVANTAGAAKNALYELNSYVGSSGETTTKTYAATGDRTHNWPDVYVGIKNSEKKTCIDALNSANALIQMADKSSGCEKKYSGSNSEIDACQAGVAQRNSGNVLFCANTYSQGFTGTADHPQFVARDKERSACYAGQGLIGVDECIQLGYLKDDNTLSACVSGAAHPEDTNYCKESSTPMKVLVALKNNMADLIEACLDGQALKLSDDTIHNGDGEEELSEEDGGTTNDTSCAIGGVGWLLCPAINFMAGLADGAFGFLSDQFLRTNVSTVRASDDNGVYVAWGIMRNFANVVFVIIFLVIIFSQLTSAGISNYGVKKMLPRLVIGAILVNLSFILCQVAVDISNILGYSIRDLFDSIATRTNPAFIKGDPIGSATGDSLLGVFGGILAIGTAAVAGYFMIAAGGALLGAALLALIVVLLILIGRQVFIVFAIVIAPIAFVSWILPNTEKLFKQWVSLFSKMLLLFPIVALIFGAATLAAAILGNVAWEQGDLLGQIIAALVPAIALFAVIPAIQGAIKAIPAVGNMATGLLGRANKNVGGKLRKSYEGSTIGRSRAIRKQGLETYRARQFAKRVSNGGLSGILSKGIPLTAGARAANQSLANSAIKTDLAARGEEVEAAKAAMENLNLSGEQRQELARTGTVKVKRDGKEHVLSGEVMQRAAIQQQLATGSMDEQMEIIEASRTGGFINARGNRVDLSAFAQTISQSALAAGVGSKDPALSGRRIDDMSQGKFDYGAAVRQAVGEGKYTAEAFAGMHTGARERLITEARAAEAAGDSSIMDALRSAAIGIDGSADIRGRVRGDVHAVSQIEGLIGRPLKP